VGLREFNELVSQYRDWLEISSSVELPKKLSYEIARTLARYHREITSAGLDPVEVANKIADMLDTSLTVAENIAIAEDYLESLVSKERGLTEYELAELEAYAAESQLIELEQLREKGVEIDGSVEDELRAQLATAREKMARLERRRRKRARRKGAAPERPAVKVAVEVRIPRQLRLEDCVESWIRPPERPRSLRPAEIPRLRPRPLEGARPRGRGTRRDHRRALAGVGLMAFGVAALALLPPAWGMAACAVCSVMAGGLVPEPPEGTRGKKKARKR